MSIPSYSVNVNDVIVIRDKSAKKSFVAENLKENTEASVDWLTNKGPATKVSRLPERKDINDTIDEQLVVEFYSR